MRFAFALGFALALAACNGPTTCVTVPCEFSDGGTTDGGKFYQACGSPGSTFVEDDFPGGKSCSCDTSMALSSDCKSCQKMLSTYCAQ